MSERYANDPPAAWVQLPDGGYDDAWATFEARYGFRAGTRPEAWPAIREPRPSLTLDLSSIADGPQRGSAYDAINAETLRAFVWTLGDVDELVVLDWQHTTYLFRPAVQAVTWQAEWAVPVYPDGDYYAFMSPDFTEGTFGHPWEQSLCIMGTRLVDTLGRSLGSWLPVLRRDGVPVERA